MGYCRVNLYKKGKAKHLFVHRLVAKAFIPNHENKPMINHKDCNPLNNCVENLEWCTNQENVDYMVMLGRNKRTEEWKQKARNSLSKYNKPVIGINVKTGEVITFKSISEAGRNGFRAGDVCNCCKGNRKTAYGYIWRYI